MSQLIFEEWISRFLGDLELRNYSPYTFRTYECHLRALNRFLTERKITDVKMISTADLMEFQKWYYYQVTKRGLPRSVGDQNSCLSAVKTFFQFLFREEQIEKDISAPLEFAKEPKRLPKNVLSPKEAKKVLDSIDISNALGYRNRCVLEILYGCGLRKNELRCLKVPDVDIEDGLLKVTEAKGGCERMVPLTQISIHLLKVYIAVIRPELLKGRNTDYLFVSYRGKQMDPESLSVLVKRCTKLAKIQKKVTCHTFRHSFCTSLLKNNAKLRHIQLLAGHKTLITTEKYLNLTLNDLRDAVKKFHPRNNGD
jgi:integrase/recombinase XerD